VFDRSKAFDISESDCCYAYRHFPAQLRVITANCFPNVCHVSNGTSITAASMLFHTQNPIRFTHAVLFAFKPLHDRISMLALNRVCIRTAADNVLLTARQSLLEKKSLGLSPI